MKRVFSSFSALSPLLVNIIRLPDEKVTVTRYIISRPKEFLLGLALSRLLDTILTESLRNRYPRMVKWV